MEGSAGPCRTYSLENCRPSQRKPGQAVQNRWFRKPGNRAPYITTKWMKMRDHLGEPDRGDGLQQSGHWEERATSQRAFHRRREGMVNRVSPVVRAYL